MEWHLESIRNIVKGQIRGANKQIETLNSSIRKSNTDVLLQMDLQNLRYWEGIRKANQLILDEIDEKLQVIRETELFTKQALAKTEREGVCPF